jgi:hypothetical protein
MNKMLVAALAALFACNTMALQLKPLPRSERHASQKNAQSSSGPYYLAVSGYCDVFQVWYDPNMNTVYGNDIGCAAGTNGQPVLGTIDTDGYDVYLSVGGSANANLIDFDIYDQIAVWGASAGGDAQLNQAALTLSTNPIAPGPGPSIIQ